MLFEIAIALILAKALNFLFEKMKQPGVIGEIIAGIILGPCVVGSLSGSSINLFGSSFFKLDLDLSTPEFKEIAFIGVIFLLFIVGLETNINDLKKTKKSGVLVAIFGIIIPFSLGCLVGLIFGMSEIQCLAIGTIFGATGVTLTIRSLADMDMATTRVGLTVQTAVIINDIIGLLILSLVLGDGDPFMLIVRIIIFFVIIFGVGLIAIKFIEKEKALLKAPIVIITVGLVICFLFSTFAENIGLAAITGAFIAGIIVKKIMQSTTMIEDIKKIGYAFFIPLFFVWVGASFNFLSIVQSGQAGLFIFFTVIFVMFSLLGNLCGGFIGARISGMSKKESLSVGIGIMPIMGVALVILTTELDKGIFGTAESLLAQQIKTATFSLIIVSSLVAPPLLKKNMGQTNLIKGVKKKKTKLIHLKACPNCYAPLQWIESKSAWFCNTCKNYTEFHSKVSHLISHKINREFMLYLFGFINIMLCCFIIQDSQIQNYLERIAAMIGVTMGTILALLIIKHYYLTNRISIRHVVS